MKVKELKKMLKHVNPEADVLISIEDSEDYFTLEDVEIPFEEDAPVIELNCRYTDSIIRKSLPVQYDAYHPAFVKDWSEEIKEQQIELMAGFIYSSLNCKVEEAMEMSKKIIDEIISLPIEEVKARVIKRECISTIVNKVVGKELILIHVLPKIEDNNVKVKVK